MANLSDIEGIGENCLTRLMAAGVQCQEQLLEQASTVSGRTDLIRATGISDTLILEWANHADLTRIQGIGSQYTRLLQNTGVNNVADLAQCDGSALHAKMLSVNAQMHFVDCPPLESMVIRWVARARGLSF